MNQPSDESRLRETSPEHLGRSASRAETLWRDMKAPSGSQNEMRVAAERAFYRYLEAPAEFAAARSLSVPAQKEGFPKLVLLDMRHWIALGRAHYGRSSETIARDALTALRRGVDSGRLVVPVTDVNIQEASKDGRLDRRERMATFMVDLSRNYCLISHESTLWREGLNALLSNFEVAPLQFPIRNILLRWGFSYAFRAKRVLPGSALGPTVNHVLDYPELSIAQIAHSNDRELLRETFAKEQAAIERIKAVRVIDQNLPHDEHLRRELSNLPRDWLRPLLPHLGIDVARFEAWMADDHNLSKFWQSVPSFHVLVQLMLTRDRNPHAPTQTNDSRDLTFLKLAIPYANVVMAENLWAHVANQSGVACLYNTEVRSDLGDLPELLCRLGCK